MDDATIAALATPVGRAGVAVIRISGKESFGIARKLVDVDLSKISANSAVYSRFLVDNQRIDDGFITLFKSPRSFTGEDVVELSVHSNPFIIEALLSEVIRLGGREALPGEFSYRAFVNDKLDLIQAESINQLIHANSRAGAILQYNNLEGQLSDLISRIREQLIQLGVVVETAIEFGEDQHIEDRSILSDLSELNDQVSRVLSSSRFNRILDKGFNVVLAGRVNVGKSSLFNYLVLENRAIVSHLPGTTRDFIEKKIYMNGFAYEITDVAGFNPDSDDEIEDEGIRRSRDRVSRSDAVVFLIDGSLPISDEDLTIYHSIRSKPHLVVVNKSELCSDTEKRRIRSFFPDEQIHFISVKEEEHLEIVSGFLKQLPSDLESTSIEMTVNARQKAHLSDLDTRLTLLLRQLEENEQITELVAEEIRYCLDTLGKISGEITADDILNGIFADFCIGK